MIDKLKYLVIYITYTVTMALIMFFCFIMNIFFYYGFFVFGLIFAFGLNMLIFKKLEISSFIKKFYDRFAPLFLFTILFLGFTNSMLISEKLPIDHFSTNYFPVYIAFICQIGIIIGFMRNKHNKEEPMNFKISLIPFIYLLVIVFFINNIIKLDNKYEFYLLDNSWLIAENAYDYIAQEPPYSTDDISKIKTDEAGIKSLQEEMVYYMHFLKMDLDKNSSDYLDEINRTNEYIKILYTSENNDVLYFHHYLKYNNLDLRILTRYLLTIDDEKTTIENNTQNNDFLNTVVFIVNENNPIDSISSDDIKKIYTGEYQYWSDLDSNLNKDKIFAFKNEIDISAKLKMDKPLIPYSKMYDYDDPVGLVSTMVEKRNKVIPYINFDNAIGFSSYATVLNVEKADEQSGIKLLAIDGVYPSEENIKSGKYSFFVENTLK